MNKWKLQWRTVFSFSKEMEKEIHLSQSQDWPALHIKDVIFPAFCNNSHCFSALSVVALAFWDYKNTCKCRIFKKQATALFYLFAVMYVFCSKKFVLSSLYKLLLCHRDLNWWLFVREIVLALDRQAAWRVNGVRIKWMLWNLEVSYSDPWSLQVSYNKTFCTHTNVMLATVYRGVQSKETPCS